MDRSNEAQRSSVRSAARLLPPLAGLLVASVITFSSSSPPSHYVSWAELLGFALARLFTISLSCVLTVAALCAILPPQTAIDQHQLFVLTPRAALWLAPLALLMQANSNWSLAAVATFAVLLTLSLRGGSAQDGEPKESLLFSLRPDPLPLFAKSNLPIAIAAALCAETGSVLFFGGFSYFGAALVGAAACALAWRSAPGTASCDGSSQWKSLPIALLAVVFTVAALIPYLHGASGIGVGSFHRYAARTVPALKTRSFRPAAQSLDHSLTRVSEGNTGIVLWPEKELHTKLVAPSPVDLTTRPRFGHSANPLVIPFDGVYWFFKSPDVRPPVTSQQAHASPETVEIRSTDRRPLSIEAHDYLGSLIDLACCSRIQVAIRNADRYPDTVSLELILSDSSHPKHAPVSLGQVMVRSTTPWKIYEYPRPVRETLSFEIPPGSRLRHFDEINIVFRLDRARSDAAARIAIDHLVLIPRGL